MADKIDVYNLALGILGMRQITSLSEDIPSVDIINVYYQPCVSELFSEFAWPFNTAKEELIAVTDDLLEMEWGYCYARPVSAAAVWAVYNDATYSRKYEQEFETVYQPSLNRQVICTDLESAYAEYSYIITDTKVYTPQFIMALAHKLASYAAPKLVADAKKRADLINTSLMFIENAKKTSFAEKRKRNEQTSAYRTAR
jgi:hypothetical protein